MTDATITISPAMLERRIAQARNEGVQLGMNIAQARAGWQPIATAPKDGTPVILWFPHEMAGYYEEVMTVIAGHWDNGWQVAHLKSHGCGCCADENTEPTHWMHFPPTPSDSGERG